MISICFPAIEMRKYLFWRRKNTIENNQFSKIRKLISNPYLIRPKFKSTKGLEGQITLTVFKTHYINKQLFNLQFSRRII